MRALLLAGACGALVVMVGCTRAPERPVNPEGRRVAPSDVKPDVELKVESVAREADTLAVTYAVHNRTARAVLLVDGLMDFGASGHPTLAPERTYVDLSGDSAVLLRMLVRVPEDLDVEAPEVPAVSRVEPGATASRRAVVPLPLRTSLPYPTGPELTRELAQVRELRLRVGYLPDAEGVTLHAGTDSRGHPVQTPEYGPTVTRQQVLDSGPLSLEGVR